MIHAVMFLLTFNTTTLEITHAQVIGGYETLEACKGRMAAAMTMINAELKDNELPQLECSTVKAKREDLPSEDEKPKTDL